MKTQVDRDQNLRLATIESELKETNTGQQMLASKMLELTKSTTTGFKDLQVYTVKSKDIILDSDVVFDNTIFIDCKFRGLFSLTLDKCTISDAMILGTKEILIKNSSINGLLIRDCSQCTIKECTGETPIRAIKCKISIEISVWVGHIAILKSAEISITHTLARNKDSNNWAILCTNEFCKISVSDLMVDTCFDRIFQGPKPKIGEYTPIFRPKRVQIANDSVQLRETDSGSIFIGTPKTILYPDTIDGCPLSYEFSLYDPLDVVIGGVKHSLIAGKVYIEWTGSEWKVINLGNRIE